MIQFYFRRFKFYPEIFFLENLYWIMADGKNGTWKMENLKDGRWKR